MTALWIPFESIHSDDLLGKHVEVDVFEEGVLLDLGDRDPITRLLDKHLGQEVPCVC